MAYKNRIIAFGSVESGQIFKENDSFSKVYFFIQKKL